VTPSSGKEHAALARKEIRDQNILPCFDVTFADQKRWTGQWEEEKIWQEKERKGIPGHSSGVKPNCKLKRGGMKKALPTAIKEQVRNKGGVTKQD